MRIYCLHRRGALPPLYFSTLKKAKDWANLRYPFINRWEKRGKENWAGLLSREDALICSLKVDP